MAMRIVIYPASGVGDKRAHNKPDLIWPAKPPLERNHDIVDQADVMIATPRTMQEEQRSGTWATIRYARKKGRELHIIWPDGTIAEENLKDAHMETATKLFRKPSTEITPEERRLGKVVDFGMHFSGGKL
jgi:hypothetical protein